MFKKIGIMAVFIGLMSINTAFAQSVNTDFTLPNVIQADLQSQRIPAGTVIKIKMESPINTDTSRNGDQFLATIMEDIKVKNSIILPVGSAIRGRVTNIIKRGFCTKPAELMLNFDHVVTPLGKQVPLYANIANLPFVTYYGSVKGGNTYGQSVQKNLDKGTNYTVNIFNYSVKEGLKYGKGFPVIITAPVGAAGGIAVGGSYLFGKSIVDIFTLGKNVKIKSGDIFDITLKEPIDIPLN